ncbi:MAG: P27 family phage terminase small subunit, partial [Oscillospiraceae bacterium]
MIRQLRVMGVNTGCYADLVNDYMTLWDIKNKLAKDVKVRGVTYEDVSSVGVKMQKSNPSVKEIVGVNRQMLSLIEKLGISPAKYVPEKDDSDDDLG